VLREFRARHDLEVAHWSLLHGDKESVQKLAEMVGFRYLPGSNKQYAHSLLISVLNQSGEIAYQQAGVGNPPDGAVGAVQRLLGSRTKVNR
jgi:cytochrome oxidase Cu insertion factor (SCO1/SenC/PrrC family)